MSAFGFLVLFIHEIKKFFYGKFVDRQESAEAFYGNVSFSFFNAPVLHAGEIIIVGKVFMTAIAFFLP